MPRGPRLAQRISPGCDSLKGYERVRREATTNRPRPTVGETVPGPDTLPSGLSVAPKTTPNEAMQGYIVCPICGQSARLLRNGHVRPHGSPWCAYKRTIAPAQDEDWDRTLLKEPAHTATRVRETPLASSPEERPKYVVRVSSRRPKNGRKPAVPDRDRVPQCLECGRDSLATDTQGRILSHKKSAAEWCSGGIEPSPEVRKLDVDKWRANRAKRSQRVRQSSSVWASSAGLPTLRRRQKS